jgi:DNA-binding CsgD family transcriptional regulator
MSIPDVTAPTFHGALGRAEPTIKNQVASCLRMFGVPSRARLMALLR